jgi:hypothetical protein
MCITIGHSGRCHHLSGSSYSNGASSATRFFGFGRGPPLRKFQFLIFGSLLEIPTARFTISSPMVFLSLPRRSCSSKSRFLVTLMPSWWISHLLPSVLPFRVPVANFFMVWFDRRSLMTASLKPVSPASCHFCTVGHPPASCGQFLLRSTISWGPNFSEDVSLASCQCCTAGHLPTGGIQFFPGSTISSGQFRWLPVAPCS